MEELSGNDVFREHVNKRDLPKVQPLTPSKSKYLTDTIQELERLLKEGHNQQVKEIVRFCHWQINHPIRRNLWVTICNYHNNKNEHEEGYYCSKRNELLGELKIPPSLPPFVDPAFCMYYFLNKSGQQAVERVLYILADLSPFIMYCPLAYPLAGIFMHYLSEEEVFWALYKLMTSKREKFLSCTRMDHEVKCHALVQLTRKFAKEAYTHLKKGLKERENLALLFLGWQWWIFKALPFHYLVRVVDCFVFEGSKVLFRVALGILILYSKHSEKEGFSLESSSGNDSDEEGGGTLQKILQFCQDIPVEVEKLLKVAFGIRGLSRKEIAKQLLKAEMFLKSQPARGRSASMDGSSPESVLHLGVNEPNRLKSDTRALSVGMVPLGSFKSCILSPEHLTQLWGWLPARITMSQPIVIFSTNEHGSSLISFFMKVEEWEPTVLVIKADNDEVFGAYCSVTWSERNRQDETGKKKIYFGTGETFLFTISPEFHQYMWVGLSSSTKVSCSANLFMVADKTMIGVGGGNGQALWLDQSLYQGKTEHCDTFNNPPLCSKSDFTCKALEVIGFK
ncbi:GTPase-activating protein skywalker-like isoform X5 [Tachypleus tridentatus]